MWTLESKKKTIPAAQAPAGAAGAATTNHGLLAKATWWLHTVIFYEIFSSMLNVSIHQKNDIFVFDAMSYALHYNKYATNKC